MIGTRIIQTSKTPANAWDLSAASFDGITVSVAGQSSGPQGVWVKPDGTKLYILDVSAIYQYSLPTAWVLTGMTYDSVSLDLSGEDTFMRGLYFRGDGLRLYVLGLINNRVYQYNLSSAWDLSSASFIGFIAIGTEDTFGHGLFFKDDGTRMFFAGYNADRIFQYTLGTAWGITSASYDSIFLDTSGEGTTPTGIFIKPDGTKLYRLDANTDAIFQYDLPTPWSLTGAAYDSVTLAVSSQETTPNGIFFRDNGMRFFITGATGDEVNQYSMSA